MVIDINSELRDFTYITSVYKCISNYNLKGHQIGRKVGDMLEILTMGAVYQCPDLLERLSIEEKLEGYTTAGHKVEFGFFNNSPSGRQLFGAIECKCVGVEETTSGKNEKNLRKLSSGDNFEIKFNGHWQSSEILFTLKLDKIVDDDHVNISLHANSSPVISKSLTIEKDQNIKVVIDEDEHCNITSPDGNMLVEVPGIIRTLNTIKFQGVQHGKAVFALFDCLTGPQTIEKAKQASLVAMDLRKKVDGYWGKEEIPAGKKNMSFIHVICEFSHWEEKSRNVISTCIDHNIIVPDVVIIKAFETFEKQFGLGQMLNKISKNEFASDAHVRNAINSILNYYENKVFYDVVLKKYIKFTYGNNSLVIQPIS